jgi:hypothetical protein
MRLAVISETVKALVILLESHMSSPKQDDGFQSISRLNFSSSCPSSAGDRLESTSAATRRVVGFGVRRVFELIRGCIDVPEEQGGVERDVPSVADMDRMKKSDVTAPAGVSGFLMALSSKGKYLMKNCDAVKRFFCLNGFEYTLGV